MSKPGKAKAVAADSPAAAALIDKGQAKPDTKKETTVVVDGLTAKSRKEQRKERKASRASTKEGQTSGPPTKKSKA